MIDRLTNPNKGLLRPFDFLKAETQILSNGIKLSWINSNSNDLLRLQFTFDSGYASQNKPLIASTCSNLLNKGTNEFNSYQISDIIEQKGAFIDSDCTADTLTITLFCLKNKLEELMSLILSFFNEANFPEEEIINDLQIRKQKFLINQEKISFIAKRKFNQEIFEDLPAYQNNISIGDFDNLKKEELKSYYQDFIQGKSFKVFLAGSIDDILLKKIVARLENYSSKLEIPLEVEKNNLFAETKSNEIIRIEKKDAMQSAVRLGCRIIPKTEIDYPNLYITNVLLGGFFGSRLMKNIREDKGYTYGIHSGLVHFKNAAYFFIGSEVGEGLADNTLKEIRTEIEQLANQKVNEEELSLLKNYIMGSLMRGFDGSFAAMDRYRMLDLLGLDYSYYQELMISVQNIRYKDINAMILSHLNFDSMIKIIVGKT